MPGTASGFGVMQMMAVGVQDMFLIHNPTITLLKSVYKRYTPFACEHMEQTFQGAVKFGAPLQALVSRNGDLIHRVYFMFRLPAIEPDKCKGSTGVYWTNSIGHAIIEEAAISVGGQFIDRQLGIYLHIWSELTNSMHNKYLGELVGRRYTVAHLKEDAKHPHTYYVPLEFWFCKNAGSSLPLIALQYHDVKIHITTKKLCDLWISEGNCDAAPKLRGCDSTICDGDLEASLLIEYVYLDGDERTRFATNPAEYLITQTQNTTEVPANQHSGGTLAIELNFNHPSKNLHWVYVSEKARCAKNYFDFGDENGEDPVEEVDLRLNNHPRFQSQEGIFFRTVIPYQAYENIPEKHIYTYEFDLEPMRFQPTGSLNWSRFDSVKLHLKMRTGCFGTVQAFTSNYNIFRCLGGMGGAAYAN